MKVKKDFEHIELETLYITKKSCIDFLLQFIEEYDTRKATIFTYSIGKCAYETLAGNLDEMTIYADESMKHLRKGRKGNYLKKINFKKIHVKIYLLDEYVILSSANISSLHKTEFYYVKKCKNIDKIKEILKNEDEVKADLEGIFEW